MTREQEAAVIQAVLDGDVNAYEALVKEYEKNVYNLALRMTGNSEDAADMAQEAFIKAYNSLTAFRGDSKFSVWLYRIVSCAAAAGSRQSRFQRRTTTARRSSWTLPTRRIRPNSFWTEASPETPCGAALPPCRRTTGRYFC